MRGSTIEGVTIDLGTLMEDSAWRPVQVTTFVLCGLVALLDGIDTQSFAVAAPAIAATFGMRVAEFGPAFAIAHLGACVGAMVCGPLSDGRRHDRFTAHGDEHGAVVRPPVSAIGTPTGMSAVWA